MNKEKAFKIIFWIVVISIFPFVLEWFLFVTPVVSKFSNDTWFSFIGSYIGAAVTLGVMYTTFKRSDEDNKELIKKQKELHEIEVQNERIAKIIHVLLVDDYYFLNPDTVGENMDRFMRDLSYVQFDTLFLKYTNDNKDILFGELLNLQKEEVSILNNLKEIMPHVDSPEKAIELKTLMVNTGLELSKIANLKRDIIKMMYDSYLEKVYEKYYS